MPTVIPVKFKYAARDLWFDPGLTDAQEGDHVICTTERGTEIGLATMDAIEMDEERLHETIGDAVLKPVLRIADAWDSCRFASWSNVTLTLEVCDGRYVYASAEKSSAGYGESGERYWLSFDGRELSCTQEDLRESSEERVILIFKSSLTRAGIRIGSAEDELLRR